MRESKNNRGVGVEGSIMISRLFSNLFTRSTDSVSTLFQHYPAAGMYWLKSCLFHQTFYHQV